MKTVKKIVQQPLLPWLVLGVLTLVWHLGLVIVDGDEVFYGNVLGRQPLWEFLMQQYEGWSSRTVIEGFLFAMAAGVCAVLLARQVTLRRLWQKLLAAALLIPMAGIQFISLWEI